jgi:SLOG-like protein
MTGILDQPFDARALEGHEIAVSVSEPDDGELAARGVSDEHVAHAFAELARQLLAAGATLAYGGDFRERGYTEKLIAVLNEHSGADRPPKTRVRQYLAWPLWQQAPADSRGKLNQVATVVPVPAPVDKPPDPDAFTASASPAARALWADSLTMMRERMTDGMTARVILGGRLTTHTSRYPGVVEEAFVAARAGKPLYILGGFGGCASCLAQLIQGERPTALTLEHQLDRTKGFDELLDGLGSIDYDEMLDTIVSGGPRSVPNGLSDEDNERLLDTADLDQVVALVLKGLRALARG